MRPSRTVASVALTATLALGALPGLAGSRTPDPDQVVDPAAFRLLVLTSAGRTDATVGPMDAASRSAGFVDASTTLVEPGEAWPVPPRPDVAQPAGRSGWEWKEPRYTLSGYATFYDNGTTAMRLPRGTRVVICGAAGCLERIVNDYGPQKEIRIVDMYRPDFFKICGCGWWSGTTWVTVKVY